jgi:hypothetical protein
MNKIFSIIAFFLIVFFTYGFYLSQFQFDFVNRNPAASPLYYTYQINQNIHSNMSLGSGSVPEIIDDAQKIQNDFLMITDLNYKVDLEQDRYMDRVGILFASKFLTEYGRYIFYSHTFKTANLVNSEMTKFFQENKTTSLIFLAHPLDRDFDEDFLGKQNLNGIEVINLKKMTQQSWDTNRISTIWSLLFYPFNPKLSLIRLFNEPDNELEIFDRISQKKKFVMFLGSEASARAIPFADWLVRFPTYERTLGIASQHLVLESELTGNMNKDAIEIQSALSNGNFFLAFDALGDAAGFEAYVTSKENGKFYKIGEEIPFQKDLKLVFHFPEPNVFYEIILFKDGKRQDHFNTFTGWFNIKEPGVYRIEVRLSARLPFPDVNKWIGWIYTNNFTIK